jgi:hypothetical protein
MSGGGEDFAGKKTAAKKRSGPNFDFFRSAILDTIGDGFVFSF